MCSAKHRTVVIMGVAGSGKSTVGHLLAQQLGWRFIEGDDFHSPKAKHMMASGIPLADSLRDSWVQALCNELSVCKAAHTPCVLSYSGLIARHRQQIRSSADNIHFFYLHGNAVLLAKRLAQRQNHFMAPAMLQSQLLTMQSCDDETDVTLLDIALPVPQLVQQITQFLAA
ncbi:gluconokinase, GntK/IdnK-type [Rheinheimera baltica]|uniref:Gluconokinase n=1 Tax=Rheinheimera baltica TaxID=67576 RepID=A0ABT9HTJ6_9GAMM|nr:gluconokinase, GntK/IdnK-type [Rheinheimera baltica]MDP5134449.1 gluconokinase, GntK/IdnK-type [Rheinheimera baltica]MDP5141275.1 gluconokinase, GntK/IdnK-type [Rheinheimera baltica]